MTTAKHLGLAYEETALEAFCQHWGVVKLAIFGSAARNDLRPDSAVDVMVTFVPESKVSAWDLVTMQDELSELFGRSTHLVEEGGVRNPYRLKDIERDLTVLYAA